MLTKTNICYNFLRENIC